MIAVNKEINDKAKKSNNVIIYGISSTNSDNFDDIKKHDSVCINALFSKIGYSGEINYIKRLKSTNNKLAPLIVSLKEDRNNLLSLTKRLRTIEECKNVYINPDMTVAERIQFNKNRLIRNNSNQKACDNNKPFWYGIRGTEVVRFKKAV